MGSLIKEPSSLFFGLALLLSQGLLESSNYKGQQGHMPDTKGLHSPSEENWEMCPAEGAKYSQEEGDFLHKVKGESSLLISTLCCNVAALGAWEKSH